MVSDGTWLGTNPNNHSNSQQSHLKNDGLHVHCINKKGKQSVNVGALSIKRWHHQRRMADLIKRFSF
jgi:hypothetical protein